MKNREDSYLSLFIVVYSGTVRGIAGARRRGLEIVGVTDFLGFDLWPSTVKQIGTEKWKKMVKVEKNQKIELNRIKFGM